MSRTILIVDDEPNIVTALEYLLQRRGYAVQIARNGEEALKLIESGPPDLVLLDVMMPLRSGYEVCQAIKARPEWRGVKIVMLSAKGRDTEVAKGLALGADLYVTKPFSTRDLVDKIEALVGGAAPQQRDGQFAGS
jgi:DNA-binding response OmpR family regulator